MCIELLFPPFKLHCLHALLSNETAEMSVSLTVKYTGGSAHTHTPYCSACMIAGSRCWKDPGL